MSRIIHLENPSILKILIQTIFFCLVIALSTQFVHAQTPPLDESLEEKAQAIDRMIMCPVCPAETIDQAQVGNLFPDAGRNTGDAGRRQDARGNSGLLR